MDTAVSPRVRCKQGVVQAGGLQLDVVCSNFGDRVFLLVTNLNKVGTLVSFDNPTFL